MHVTPSLPAPHIHPAQADSCLGDWHRANKVLIYNEEAVRISRFVMAYPNSETGGDLFGFWTNSGAPVISYAIGPGRCSAHWYSSFYQDEDWLHEAGTDLYDRHGLQHIGEWHSHHHLGLNLPSAGDIRTVVRGLAAKNWAKFVLMIATKDASVESPVVQNYYLVNPNGDYKPLRPGALPGQSPFRTVPIDPREEPMQGPAADSATLSGTNETSSETEDRPADTPQQRGDPAEETQSADGRRARDKSQPCRPSQRRTIARSCAGGEGATQPRTSKRTTTKGANHERTPAKP